MVDGCAPLLRLLWVVEVFASTRCIPEAALVLYNQPLEHKLSISTTVRQRHTPRSRHTDPNEDRQPKSTVMVLSLGMMAQSTTV